MRLPLELLSSLDLSPTSRPQPPPLLLFPPQIYIVHTRPCRRLTITTVLPTRYRSPSLALPHTPSVAQSKLAIAQPTLRHTPGYAIRHPGERPIERCRFLHSRRSGMVQNRYQTNSSKRFQAGFSSLKKRKRTARRANRHPNRRADVTVSDRDESAALTTTIQIIAVATPTTKKNREESADAGRAREEALAEA